MALTSQQQAIQNQIDGYDSNTSTQVLLSTLLRAIDAGDIRQGYTDSAAFPTNDSALIGLIGYDEFDSDLRFIGRDLDIHKIDSATAPFVLTYPTTHFQGTNFGYYMGGREGSPQGHTDRYQKFPFAADGDAADVNDIVQSRYNLAGHRSSTHGYVSGGHRGQPTRRDDIDKFPFASEGHATDVGDLISTKESVTGNSSEDHGYTSGGLTNLPSFTYFNVIEKFSFSTDGNGTDVADLLAGIYEAAGQPSDVSGYVTGGNSAPPATKQNVIQKFPFSTDANSTDVGDLTETKRQATGQSSGTHGYVSGGEIGPPSPTTNVIEKFSFSTDGNATDVGDLLSGINYAGPTGQSAETHGYHAGGNPSNTIQKFSFVSDGNATDVGDLVDVIYAGAGTQN